MNKKLTAAILCAIAFAFGSVFAFGQEPARNAAADQQILSRLDQLIANSEAALARNAAETRPAPATVLNPGMTSVKVKIGGYRLASYYNSGEGGTIAAEAHEAEVISPDLQPGLQLARELRDDRNQRMREDVAKLFCKPFTRIETRTVTIREQCAPQVPYCCGLGAARYGYGSGYCCGITRNCAPAVTSTCCPTTSVVATTSGSCCNPPAVVAAPSCSCNGTGCAHCRGPGFVAAPVYTGRYVSYGRCAAWGRVVELLPGNIYRDPPHGRAFWCDCADHRAAVLRAYGPSAIWELVPCMCAGSCGRCGGAGRCGH